MVSLIVHAVLGLIVIAFIVKLNPAVFRKPADGPAFSALESAYYVIGIACRAAGLRLIRVAPTGSHMHKTHRITASTNREVRDALEAGAFDE